MGSLVFVSFTWSIAERWTDTKTQKERRKKRGRAADGKKGERRKAAAGGGQEEQGRERSSSKALEAADSNEGNETGRRDDGLVLQNLKMPAVGCALLQCSCSALIGTATQRLSMGEDG